MADGAWPDGSGGMTAMDRPDELRALLTALNTHLTSNSAAFPPATVRELEVALDLLRVRIARQEESPGFIEPFSRHMQEGGEPRPASEALASPPPNAWSDGASRSRRGASPEPWPIRLVLASSTGAAALSALGAAVLGFSVADIPGVRPTTPAPVVRAEGEADLRGDMAAQDLRIAAIKGAPTDPRPPGATSPGALADSYDSAAAALRRGDAQGLSRLTGLAQDGDTRAQLHLAGLYETGQGGLPRDLSGAP
ncbi:MAG: hypothetical protein U1C74_19125, partial [Phenylobacterium sp.]|nr:hypothetical protein [Phenylobacterium sp.]